MRVTGASPSIHKTDPQHAGSDLGRAIECLVKLGRVDEIDAFREAVVAVHKASWRLLQAAAESYLNDPNTSGPSSRVSSSVATSGSRTLSASYERDRARALQLLLEGLDRAPLDPDRARWAGTF